VCPLLSLLRTPFILVSSLWHRAHTETLDSRLIAGCPHGQGGSFLLDVGIVLSVLSRNDVREIVVVCQAPVIKAKFRLDINRQLIRHLAELVAFTSST